MFGFFDKGGAVGQTAEWVATAYKAAEEQGMFQDKSLLERQVYEHFVDFALDVRFHDNAMHPHKEEIKRALSNNLSLTSGRGLYHFTVAILTVEAGYLKNSPANIRKFTNIIMDTLDDKGISLDAIRGDKIFS